MEDEAARNANLDPFDVAGAEAPPFIHNIHMIGGDENDNNIIAMADIPLIDGSDNEEGWRQ